MVGYPHHEVAATYIAAIAKASTSTNETASDRLLIASLCLDPLASPVVPDTTYLLSQSEPCVKESLRKTMWIFLKTKFLETRLKKKRTSS